MVLMKKVNEKARKAHHEHTGLCPMNPEYSCITCVGCPHYVDGGSCPEHVPKREGNNRGNHVEN